MSESLDPPKRDHPTAIRMIALDLDGTLLQKGDAILDRDRDALAEARHRGVAVVLASARPPRSAKAIHGSLGLDTPYVAYNGALVRDMAEERDLFHRPMDASLAAEVIAACRALEPSVVLELERADRGMTDRLHPNLRTQTSLRFEMDRVAPVDELLADGPVTKVMLMASTPRVQRLRAMLDTDFRGRVKIAVSDRHLIQVLHPAVDKAAGVSSVAAQLGVSAAEVLAVGDAPNDVELLRWAGVGVAVGTGWDEAKAAADVVGPSNKEGVVGWAVRRFVLGES